MSTSTSETTETRYAVEIEFTHGWENCWTDDSGAPLTFATFEEAEDEMKDYIIDCINAVEGGLMDESPDPASMRIVEVVDEPGG